MEELSIDKNKEVDVESIEKELTSAKKKINSLEKELAKLKNNMTSSNNEKPEETGKYISRREFLKKAGIGSLGLGALLSPVSADYFIKDDNFFVQTSNDGGSTLSEGLFVDQNQNVDIPNGELNIQGNRVATRDWANNNFNNYSDSMASNAAPVQTVNGKTGNVEISTSIDKTKTGEVYKEDDSDYVGYQQVLNLSGEDTWYDTNCGSKNFSFSKSGSVGDYSDGGIITISKSWGSGYGSLSIDNWDVKIWETSNKNNLLIEKSGTSTGEINYNHKELYPEYGDEDWYVEFSASGTVNGGQYDNCDGTATINLKIETIKPPTGVPEHEHYL